MNKILEKLDTTSKNVVDLTPHYIDRSRNVKLLEALEARNRVKVSKNTYKFNDMLNKLKKRDIFQQTLNPSIYSSKAPEREIAERAELLRMAKITASESRDPKTNVPTIDYIKNKEQFLTTYMSKIAHFGLLPDIEAIFEMFKDPNYTEKGFDKDYLAQGTSDAYLTSMRNKANSESLIKKLEDLDVARSTDMGELQTLLKSSDLSQQAIGAETVQQLQLLRDEQEARVAQKQYKNQIANETQDTIEKRNEAERIFKEKGASALTEEQRKLLSIKVEDINQFVEQKIESEYKQQEDKQIQDAVSLITTLSTFESITEEMKKGPEFIRGKAGLTKPFMDYVKEEFRKINRQNVESKAIENKYKSTLPIEKLTKGMPTATAKAIISQK